MTPTAATPPADPAQALAEAMARAGFREFCRTFVYIENEKGEIGPFILNEAQEILLAEIERQQSIGKSIRVVCCKGRQQGVSTFVQMYIFWRCITRRTRALTVGHQLPAVHELFSKFDRAYREMANLPVAKELEKSGIILRPPVEPGAGERGRRFVFSDPLGSIARYDSAADPDSVGRGQTFRMFHSTECPMWSRPSDTMQAVLATIPDDPETFVFVESTAKGASGWFYDVFTEAMDDVKRGIEPDFYPMFIPWFLTKRYARKRRSGEPALNKTEREHAHKHGLSNEQALWYRDQRRKFGDRVMEEYPSTWQEAFLSSGLPYFRRDALEEYRQRANDCEPIRTGRFRMVAPKVAAWSEQPGGETRIYGNPEEGSRYSIGVDFASGRAKDFSAIVVIDVERRAVVATHKSKWQPDDVLDEAVLLGLTYKGPDGRPALIVPERNGIGQALVDRLTKPASQRGLAYANVYREHDTVAVKHHRGVRYGWATSNRNRQWLLEELASSVHQRSIDIPCQFLVGEMGTFVFVDDDGEHAEASEGANDDLVMAFAFAHRGMTYLPTQGSPGGRISPADRRESIISGRTGY